MFNSKSKKRIEELETANANLQKQYDLAHGFLLQRQDEVVALQREIVTLKAQPSIPATLVSRIRSAVKDVINDETNSFLKSTVVSIISERIGDILGEQLAELSDSDEDEDEDEDEDD